MRKMISCVAAMLCVMCGCSRGGDPVEPTPSDDLQQTSPPRISLDRSEPIFKIKINESLVISPHVENARGSVAYRWSIGTETVGTDPEFTYTGVEAGSVYIEFEVAADNGTCTLEMRVDVMPEKYPCINMNIPPEGFTIPEGQSIQFDPQVDNAENAVFEWTVDDIRVSDQRCYTFVGRSEGVYEVRFTAANNDGQDSVLFSIRVCTEDQMGFGWSFENTRCNVALGRTLFLRPYSVVNAFDAVYSWSVDGQSVQSEQVDTSFAGAEPATVFAFTPTAEGLYRVEVRMTNSYTSVSQIFEVTCCPPEGTYRRVASASSSPDFERVYEYLPAAGQYINDNFDAADMQTACAWAENTMRAESCVSLGAFGGYIVAGFDHSIVNDGDYNIRIYSNSFAGSSEPGIVWVMQDENGNGLPDDTWYELRGSDSDATGARSDYAVTYYRPDAPFKPVLWTDNEGAAGQVDYLAAFHHQDYYFPAWHDCGELTLVGRKLIPKTEKISDNYWVNHPYDWGYADNFSPIDRLSDDDDNHDAGMNCNHFRISDAVCYDGLPADLKYIDFIKVQTGVNSKSGWLGEVSTEVMGFADYNMIKN